MKSPNQLKMIADPSEIRFINFLHLSKESYCPPKKKIVLNFYEAKAWRTYSSKFVPNKVPT